MRFIRSGMCKPSLFFRCILRVLPVCLALTLPTAGKAVAAGGEYDLVADASGSRELHLPAANPRDIRSIQLTGLDSVPEAAVFSALAPFTGLQKLRLSGKLAHYTFDGLAAFPKLRFVSLEADSLSVFPLSLTRLPELHVLHLQRNRLEKLPEEIGLLHALKVLDLSGNALTVLPSAIGNCRRLETLNLFDNALDSLPASLGACRNLSEVDLRKNFITACPQAMAEIMDAYKRERDSLQADYEKKKTAYDRELRRYDSLNRAAPGIPHAVPRLPGMPGEKQLLVKLDTGCRDGSGYGRLGREIRGSMNGYVLTLAEPSPELLLRFSRLSCLQEIRIDGYTASRLPFGLADLKQLKKISIENAPLLDEQDFGFLAQLPALEEVRLVNCGLKAIPAYFSDINSLQTLCLDGNRIRLIGAEAASVKKLARLSVKNNPLHKVSDELCASASLRSFTCSKRKLRKVPACLRSRTTAE